MYDIPQDSRPLDIGKERQGQGAITRLDLFAAAAYAANPRPLPECYCEARKRIAEYKVMTMNCADGCWDASEALYPSAAGASLADGWQAVHEGCIGAGFFLELGQASQKEIREQYPQLSEQDLAATKWARKLTREHRR